MSIQQYDGGADMRRLYAGLSVALLGFAVYGSLLPFDFKPIRLQAAVDSFLSVLLSSPQSRISRSDFLANILLFFPIGYTLAGSLRVGGGNGWRTLAAVATILAISTTASLVAEFLQMFAGNRVPSNTDIAAQIVGSTAGLGAWALVGPQTTVWLHDTLAVKKDDRPARLLAGFALGWVFVNLAPFDITVDAGDLAARLRSGKISLVPFSAADWISARSIWDALAETLSAIPLGAFGVIGWRSPGASTRTTAFATGLVIVVSVEMAQAFISSHVASGTDVIFGAVGVALGVTLARRFLATGGSADADTNARAINWAALTILLLWICVLCAYHWAPYDFRLDSEAVRRKISRISLLPFEGYRSGSYLNALNNLLTKMALALPVGLLGTFVLRPAHWSRQVTTLAWSVVAVAVFAGIELGQFFLPARSPDPTDVLVGVSATYLGLQLGCWLAWPLDPGSSTADNRIDD